MPKTQDSIFGRADTESIIQRHKGNNAFLEHLSIADDTLLTKIIGRYICFNAVFGGGVANLAGEITEKRSVFEDSSEKIKSIRDRSSIVAADVFFAAIDEFGDRSFKSKFTHRALAQATLKGVSEYYHYHPDDFDTIIGLNTVTKGAIEAVAEGYLINQTVDEMSIMRAIGFHTSSEILADNEFRILDSCMNRRFPELTDFLKRTNVTISDILMPAYAWIKIHTSVEINHFNFAVKSANSALKYYAGSRSKKEVKRWIMEGFGSFSDLQTVFMIHLTDD